MTKPIFVESPVDIYRGDAARERLRETNDTRFEVDGSVLQVDEERWQVAQEYQRQSWLVHNRGAKNDRNDYHAEQFNHYESLPDDLGKVVELGCGPFTNLRMILPNREATEVTLLDPLIKEFLDHPHCAYKDGTLCGHDVTMVAKPIEEWKTRKKFDTVVMVNVLAHCYDIPAVFDRVWKLLKKGGLLVFGGFRREIDAATLYDAGHPLSPKADVLQAFMDRFERVYLNGEYYFIGRKP